MEDKRVTLRNRLQDYNLSYSWLIVGMRRKGLNVEKSTLSSVMSGVIVGERAEKILESANVVLDEYAMLYLDRASK